MTLTNPDRPNGALSSGAGGPHRRVSRPLVFATAVVLAASGGVGVSAASAGPPPPAPTESPTESPTGSPTEPPTESPTESPTSSPTGAETPAPGETVTPTPTPTATTAPQVPLIAFPGALHGEFVLPAEDGCGFTVFAQTGAAIALTEDSITVRSQDGFERAYAIDDSTRTLAGRRGNVVRQGDWVSVTATTQGETATAAYVFDLSRPSKRFWRGDGWWLPRQWRPDGRWRTPTPTPCPTPPVETPTAPPLPTPTDAPTVPTDAPTVPTETPAVPTPEPTPTVTDTVPPSPTPTP
ncbi:hypothetical protein [Streptosporangium sp. NPDC001681]|uniref:hypothetical protein n=1 Tax=Streptosporangium sp. NPDC001681 TaxID=3154395 RepID=UPI0033214706